jgi:E-phenylitaconyl-CoA hydratase
LSTIEIKTDGAVACIMLARPEKRNAIDEATRAALTQAFDSLGVDDSVRVVVLTGAGTAFCAGVDLGGATSPPDPNRPRLVDPLDRFAKPIVAAINGVAVGGGLEMALACDIRIASTTARFGLTEVKIGSLPGSGGTQRLPIIAGPSLAAQMLFTGELIDAERALACGLVSELCEPDKLVGRALEIAQLIARNAPLSVVAAKRALRAALESQLAKGLDLERTLFNELAGSQDRQEGRLAFRERRPPNFKGR